MTPPTHKGYPGNPVALQTYTYTNKSIEKNPPTNLLVLVPGQRLRGQHEPVLFRPALHNTDVDGQPTTSDHLQVQGRDDSSESWK